MPSPTPRTLRSVRARLLTWYGAAHRDFGWRATRDPYAVLVSEVMLQQTQAGRVRGRWERFMARFPTPQALAAAPAAHVLAEWSGLGYNRRAVALQRAAATVVRDGWPTGVAELERLPGVGPYTARALASLSFGAPVGVVDTNVRRWLIRRFGIPDNRARLQEVADGLASLGADANDAAAWTHATMEFGATICRAARPRCTACPIAAGCPSRTAAVRVRVPRQAALRGSDRAVRGALIRRLGIADGHEMTWRAARVALDHDATVEPPVDEARVRRIVAGLERDGLIHRHGRRLRLGAARIGP